MKISNEQLSKLYEEENGLVEIDRSAPAVSITMCVGERGY